MKKFNKTIKHAVQILINNYTSKYPNRLPKKDKTKYKEFLIGIYNRLDEIGLIYSSMKDISFNKAIEELGINHHIEVLTKRIDEFK